MSLPLIDIKCSCPYENDCKSLGIPQEMLKGLIYLMGLRDGEQFATMMAERKLRRKGISKDRFLSFIHKVESACPFYKHF